MSDFVDRMRRAAWLDAALYEEVEADRGATAQATAVVVLSSVAAGIGTIAHGGLLGVVTGTIFAVIAWYLWAVLTYWLGTRVFPEPQTQADVGELLRTTGFSSSPGLLRVVGIIPSLTTGVFVAAGIWMLVAMVIAVRQALDYRGTWRAIAVCGAGFLIQALILVILFNLLGGSNLPE